MNMLAYLIVKAGPVLPLPFAWIINFLIYCLLALIVWLIFKKIAIKIGADADIVNLVGLVLLLFVVASLFAGCATNTGVPWKDRLGRVSNAAGEELFNSVLSFGLSEGRNLLTGQNGQDAAAGAFQAASGGLISSGAFEHYMSAWAGPQVAAVAAEQFAKANPQTPAQSAKVANTIGAALQLAANMMAK